MEILTDQCLDVLIALELHQHSNQDLLLLSRSVYQKPESVQQQLDTLEGLGYIEHTHGYYQVTDSGYAHLKPYQVKQAIILAAGFGSRMTPVTLDTPKPLVKVNGVPMIEVTIQALQEKGITNIALVVGYKKEKFYYLAEKYPGLQIFVNDHYMEENNISSAILVKDRFCDTYVFNGDILITNRDIIRRYEKRSCYFGTWVEKMPKRDGWELEHRGEKACGMRKGGENTYMTIPISFWNADAGKQYEKDITELYAHPDKRNLYWEDVVLTQFNEHYDIDVRRCELQDITEIDTLDELAAIDPSYKKYLSK